jgi:hypothetical protein
MLAALAPSRAQPLADDILGALVICTAHGAQSQGEGNSETPAGPTNHCPACTLIPQFALAASVPASVIAFARPPSARATPATWRAFAFHIGPGGIRSRAPPRFA